VVRLDDGPADDPPEHLAARHGPEPVRHRLALLSKM